MPVLPHEVLGAWLPPHAHHTDGRFVDCTLGGGGHAALLLRAAPRATLLGLDRDSDALVASLGTLSEAGVVARAMLRKDTFAHVAEQCASLGWTGRSVDGVLADLGVSSWQLDSPRGFSYADASAPLDMRFDAEDSLGLRAADLIAHASEVELARVLRDFGEEPAAAAVARAMVEQRDRATPIETGAQLSAIVEHVVRRRARHTGGDASDARRATARVFQALRIAVNDEMGAVAALLAAVPPLLRPGGRFAVISFHSLEDRLVKAAFRRLVDGGEASGGRWRHVTRGPATATEAEIALNSRARSAKLRAVELTMPPS